MLQSVFDFFAMQMNEPSVGERDVVKSRKEKHKLNGNEK